MTLAKLKALSAKATKGPFKFTHRLQAGDGDPADGSSATAFTEFTITAANGTVIDYYYDPNEASGEEIDLVEANMELHAYLGTHREALIRCVEALKALRDDLADTLEASIDAACPHDECGYAIREKMDEPSRSMIEGMGALLDQADVALAALEEKQNGD